MRSTIIRIAAVLAMATLAFPSALAQAAPKINSITIVHEGPAAVSDELIRANIRVKKGDAFNQNPVDDDYFKIQDLTRLFFLLRGVENF